MNHTRGDYEEMVSCYGYTVRYGVYKREVTSRADVDPNKRSLPRQKRNAVDARLTNRRQVEVRMKMGMRSQTSLTGRM